MHSSSSELLLDQQQELRRKKLLELVAPKKKKKVPRTCRQRVWFYTTSIVALTAVSAGSSLLFFVPLYVDPAISTLRADFTLAGNCVTTRREDRRWVGVDQTVATRFFQVPSNFLKSFFFTISFSHFRPFKPFFFFLAACSTVRGLRVGKVAPATCTAAHTSTLPTGTRVRSQCFW